MSVELRDRVSLAPAASHLPEGAVSTATFERLRSMVTPHGWTSMLSEYEAIYRAWIRHTDGRRLFGKPAGTAEEVARSLLDKVRPWAAGEAGS